MRKIELAKKIYLKFKFSLFDLTPPFDFPIVVITSWQKTNLGIGGFRNLGIRGYSSSNK